MFRSRMTAEQYARAKAQSRRTNELNQLADAANGYGVSSARQASAARELAESVGDKRGRRLQQDSRVRNRAR